MTAAQAQERASKADAVALVKRTVALMEQLGPEPVIDAVNNKDRRFLYRGLYVFIHDIRVDGLVVAHGANNKLAGRNVIDFRDQNGKYFIREFYEIAKTKGSGWSDYLWANAQRTRFEEKTSYLERVGNYIVGVGVYKPNRPNRNTVGIMSGNPLSAPTYLQMAYDLAVVLNDDDLRVVPVVGIGGVQNIRDVRSLKGIDIGFTQSNILNNYRLHTAEQVGDVEGRKLVYIAKLFTEEVHVVAGPGISSIEQLQGKKVNLDENGSGTQFTLRDVFKEFDIRVEEVNLPQADALRQVRSGKIAATILVSGKSATAIASIRRQDGLKLLPVRYVPALQDGYLPAEFSSDDYPNLIAPGESVETVAVSAVLVAYNWEEGSERYRRVKKFAEALLDKIDQFQKPPRHPKWREVNLASKLPGWERFDPMEELLASNLTQFKAQPARSVEPVTASDNTTGSLQTEEEVLFEQFKRWLDSQRSQAAQ